MARQSPEKLAAALRANLKRRKGSHGQGSPKPDQATPRNAPGPGPAPASGKDPQNHKEKGGNPPSRQG